VAFSISGSGFTLNVNATDAIHYLGTNVRVQIKDSSDGFGVPGITVDRLSDSYKVYVRADGISMVAGSISLGYTSLKYGEIRLRNSAGQETVITPTSITVNGRVL
jgi:hypothetical protein